jgi:hypothetical protein
MAFERLEHLYFIEEAHDPGLMVGITKLRSSGQYLQMLKGFNFIGIPLSKRRPVNDVVHNDSGDDSDETISRVNRWVKSRFLGPKRNSLL